MVDHVLALKSNQIVISSGLQIYVIPLAHSGYLGIVKRKRLLRTTVCFPKLDESAQGLIQIVFDISMQILGTLIWACPKLI